MSCEIVKLSNRKELKETAAAWFASKWNVPLDAYLESIENSFDAIVPCWYVCLENGRIVSGMGVIENDFHERKDLRPNVCAVYTEPDCRGRGIAGKMLDFVCNDMHFHGIDTLYLLTDHAGFYERYGWEFHCMVRGDGEEKTSRMYVHKQQEAFSLNSERLLIAPMQMDELQETVRKQSVPELRQAFQEMLDACLKEPEHRIWYAPWKISLTDKPTETIGELGFRGPAVDGVVEIGYGLEPGFEGHGYMTEAVRTVIQWAFSLSEVTAVVAETAPDNIASQKILKRLDFIPCGMGSEGPRFKKTSGKRESRGINTMEKQNKWSTGIRIALSIPFLAIGAVSLTLTIVCFLSRPAGGIGSTDSLCFGMVFLFSALLCAVIFFLLNERKRKAFLVLYCCYEIVPLLIAMFFTTVIVINSVRYYLKYSQWTMCRPSDLLYLLVPWSISLVGAYGLCRLMKRPKKAKTP